MDSKEHHTIRTLPSASTLSSTPTSLPSVFRLKCDSVSRCKWSSVTEARNSRVVAILAWTLVAVTSDVERAADPRWQADEEDRCSGSAA